MRINSLLGKLCVLVCWIAAAAPVQAELKLPNVFSDRMVLQRDRDVPIWGQADPNAEVHIVLGDALTRATADSDGRWKAQLPKRAAGGPHKIVVESGDDRVEINEVLFGEVWVASGQSNMQWSVKQAANAEEEIAAANNDQVRMFNVPRRPAGEPQDDTDAQWQKATPTNVPNWSAVGYFFARKLNKDLGVPVGILHTSWGGTRAEAWTSIEALQDNDLFEPILERSQEINPKNAQHKAAHLYNGMLTPLIPYGIQGAIWYQGESNAGRAYQYAHLFPTMIRDWRARWDQGDFPFLFVQLAPYRYGRADPENLAELWDAQFKTLRSVKNAGMAVTTDITQLDDIHPRNKQDVGKRLALWALAKTYGKDVDHSGPLFKSNEAKDGKIVLHFEHADGLKARDGESLSEFTIAGEDKEFVPARAKIEGNSVVVWAEDVDNPVAVRFGWHDTTQPNLVNASGLPASPFRTDDWTLKTTNNLRP